MMRRPMMRRGPGLVRTVARTAVVAGTATAVSRGVSNKMNKSAEQKAQAQANEAQVAQQQQVPAATQAVAAEASEDDMVAKLQELANLHSSGVLSDEEFAAAKAKLLG
jgi:negative regulator of sigma E activity